MKKNLLIITWSIMMLPDLQAQSKHGIENYNTLGAGKENVWVPVIHYKGKRAFYAEARYNYEERNTGSVYAGSSFEGGKKIQYSITPMAGFVFGAFNGMAAAARVTTAIEQLGFSCQLQYTVNRNDRTADFFYNWSELSYSFAKKMYGGISIQQTKLYRNSMRTETGLLIGFSSGKISIPVYFFNPARQDRHIMTGIIIEWE